MVFLCVRSTYAHLWSITPSTQKPYYPPFLFFLSFSPLSLRNLPATKWCATIWITIWHGLLYGDTNKNFSMFWGKKWAKTASLYTKMRVIVHVYCLVLDYLQSQHKILKSFLRTMITIYGIVEKPHNDFVVIIRPFIFFSFAAYACSACVCVCVYAYVGLQKSPFWNTVHANDGSKTSGSK